MSGRPRVAVITYGSLLDPDDLDALFTELTSRVLPITVDGYKRVFNQKASWRDADGESRAVLNVVRHEGAWFNGLLVTDLRREEFANFRERERGYRLVEVAHDQIDLYDSSAVSTDALKADRSPLSDQDLVLVPTGTKVTEDITPIDSYVDLCCEGAEQWGEAFLSDFLRTTRLPCGDDLTTYRED